MITISIEDDENVFDVPVKAKGSVRLNVFELYAIAGELGWFKANEAGEISDPSPSEVGPAIREIAWSPTDDSLQNFTDRELFAVAFAVFRRANTLGNSAGLPPASPPAMVADRSASATAGGNSPTRK